jgi:hypothetical protein
VYSLIFQDIILKCDRFSYAFLPFSTGSTVRSAESALFAVSAATLCCGSNFFLLFLLLSFCFYAVNAVGFVFMQFSFCLSLLLSCG